MLHGKILKEGVKIIVQEKINVKVTNMTVSHFQNLGYDVDNGSIINIPVFDLPRGSGIYVDVQCNYCLKIFKKQYRRYLQTKDDVCCKDCRTKKSQKIQTEKYGVPCVIHTTKNTRKKINTWLLKYGTDHPMKNEKVKEKFRNSMIEKYGVPYSIFIDKNKEDNKFNKYSFIPTSKNQFYLNSLYKGRLNYKILNYFIDCFIPEHNLIVEYNGGGHNLSVHYKKITQKEFDEREIDREKQLTSLGYNYLKIIDTKDKLEKDTRLILVKDNAINNNIKFKHNMHIFNIDENRETSFKI